MIFYIFRIFIDHVGKDLLFVRSERHLSYINQKLWTMLFFLNVGENSKSHIVASKQARERVKWNMMWCSTHTYKAMFAAYKSKMRDERNIRLIACFKYQMLLLDWHHIEKYWNWMFLCNINFSSHFPVRHSSRKTLFSFNNESHKIWM